MSKLVRGARFFSSKYQPNVLTTQLRTRDRLEEAQAELSNDTTPEAEALRHPDFFNVHNLFTVRDLFNARVHFGHKEGSLDDRMKPYVLVHAWDT